MHLLATTGRMKHYKMQLTFQIQTKKIQNKKLVKMSQTSKSTRGCVNNIQDKMSFKIDSDRS